MSLDIIWDYFMRLVKEQLEGVSYENLCILILAEIIVVNLVCFVYTRFTGNKIKLMTKIAWSLLIGYGCFIYMVTFDRREIGSRTGIHTTIDFGSLQGDYLASQQLVYCILNVILFIPWGAALTMIKRNAGLIGRSVMIVLYSFLTSFIIETMQLITEKGYFEVTDFVTNVTGGIIGCIIMNILIALTFAFSRNR